LAIVRDTCYKKVQSVLSSSCLLMFITVFSSCGYKDAMKTVEFYAPTEGEYIHNIYGYNTENVNYEFPYESLEEATDKGKFILTMQDGIDGSDISFTD